MDKGIIVSIITFVIAAIITIWVARYYYNRQKEDVEKKKEDTPNNAERVIRQGDGSTYDETNLSDSKPKENKRVINQGKESRYNEINY